MSHAIYVGRVGALAVALGVGAAVATGYGIGSPVVAWAEEGSESAENAPVTAADPSSDPVDPPNPAALTDGPELDAGSKPGSVSAPDSGSPVPEMQFSNTGGAHLSGVDEDGTGLDATTQAPELQIRETENAPTLQQTGNPPPTAVIDKPVMTPNAPDPGESAVGAAYVAPTEPGITTTRTLIEEDDDSSAAQFTGGQPTARTMSALIVDDPATSPQLFIAAAAAPGTPAPAPLQDQPDNLADALLGAPAVLANIFVTAITTLLTSFLSPGPTTPAPPMMLFVVMGWVQRELQRSFFNQSPIAVVDAVATAEDTGVPIPVLANDIDGDLGAGDVLTVTDYTQPTHGTVVLNPNGTFTYTPTNDFSGTDTFTYTVSDAASPWHIHSLAALFGDGGHISTATATITVTPVDDPPVAVADTATVTEDSTATLINVLDQRHRHRRRPQKDHRHHPAQRRQRHLHRHHADLHTDCQLQRHRHLHLHPQRRLHRHRHHHRHPRRRPTCRRRRHRHRHRRQHRHPHQRLDQRHRHRRRPQKDHRHHPAQRRVNVTFTDTTLTYTPTANFSGTDTFTYTLNGGSTATATITVTPVDDPPVAVADTATVTEDSTATLINVLTNDTDIDAGLKKITATTQPSGGNVTFTDTTLTYTPTANFSGTDTFTYTLNGGSTATATITVTPVDDPPVAVADTATVTEDNPRAFTTAELLDNDTDPDTGDVLHIAAVNTTPNTHGTVVLNPNGTVTYTPTTNYSGPADFTYTVADTTNTPSANTATVTLTVTPIEDAPIAANDTATVTEDNPRAFTTAELLDNDTDPDTGDVLHIAAVNTTPNTHGTVVLNPNGTVTYTPTTNYSGPADFTYTVADTTNTPSANTATVTLTVTPIEDAPIAAADTYTITEGHTLDIAAPGVLTNDTDPDGDTPRVIMFNNPQHGTLTNGASDGSFTYVPDDGYLGTDTFNYQISDGTGQPQYATGTITITVIANRPPVTATDTYTITEGHTLDIAAPGVLTNDTDPDGDTPRVIMFNNPQHGTLTNGASDGSFTYVPDDGYLGTDTFNYQISDGTGQPQYATGTITITVIANRPPVTATDTYTITEGHTLDIAAPGVLTNDTDPDGDTPRVIMFNNPQHGTLTNGASDGSFTYVPDDGYLGTDTFNYQISDGTGQPQYATGTITITVIANRPPVTATDTYTITEGHTLDIAAPGVLTNDTDPDGDTPRVIMFNNPQHGTLTNGASDGSFTYVPDDGYLGTDTFNYQISDGTGQPQYATGTITITVIANRPPVTATDTYTITENGTLTVPAPGVLTNDTDPDGGTLTVQGVINAQHGDVQVSSDGSFTYQPDSGYAGPDSFTYTVTDSIDTATATVNITVTAVNERPVAGIDYYTVSRNQLLTVTAPGILANDTDADGDTLTVQGVVNAPQNGEVRVSSDGSFTYQPDSGYAGPDSFTYNVTDGQLTAQASVNITVIANDAPVIDAVASTPGIGDSWIVAVTARDPDGDPVTTALSAVDVAHVTVADSPDGSFTVTVTDAAWAAANPGAQVFVTVTASDGIADPVSTTQAIGTVSNLTALGAVNVLTATGTIANLGALSTFIPALPAGVTYTQAAGGQFHTVLLRSDGIAIAVGDNTYRQATIPALPDGVSYTAISADAYHTLLLRSDGTAVDTEIGSSIPALPDGVTYTQIAAGAYHNVFLRSDGTAIASGRNDDGQTDIPALPDGMTYTQVAASGSHTVLLRSDGAAIAFGRNDFGQTDIPALPDGMTYTQVAAGGLHTVLLRSDGAAIAFGHNVFGQATIPALPEGMTYTQVTASAFHTVLLRSDGTAIAVGNNSSGQAAIPALPEGTIYTDIAAGANVTILLTAATNQPVAVGDAVVAVQNTPLVIAPNTLLANDSSPGGDALTIVVVTAAGHGATVLSTDGTIVYTPDNGYRGRDTFTYTVTDGTLADVATVSVIVGAVNNVAPVIDSVTTVPGIGNSWLITAATHDPDGDEVTVTLTAADTDQVRVIPRARGSFTVIVTDAAWAAANPGAQVFVTVTASDGIADPVSTTQAIGTVSNLTALGAVNVLTATGTIANLGALSTFIPALPAGVTYLYRHATSARSMSLMPTKGAKKPPRP